MKKLRAFLEKYREIIAYLFWGVMTTLVSWLSYALFELIFHSVPGQLFGVALSIQLANVLSWICAVLFAYVTNKLWVFDSKSWEASVVWPELLKFLSARAATGVLEVVGVPLLVRLGLDQTLLGREGFVAKILVSVVVIVLNYVLSKLVVFRKDRERRQDDET